MFCKKIKFPLLMALTIGLFGCATSEKTYVSVKNYTQGEYYLQSDKYEECITKFDREIERYPSDAKAQFYLGRCYLAVDKNRAALTHLKKAVQLNQGDPDYYFWQGVAYSSNGKPRSEQKSYEQALAVDENHVQALVYMGHNRFEDGQYRVSLGYYNRALRQEPFIPQALYNRAMALRKLNRTPEEIRAWKTYLAAYPDGPFTRRAAQYLNENGRFDYRNHTLGKRIVTLPQVQFEPSSSGILKVSAPSLKELARITARNPNLVLHIVAYQKNNRKLAEVRAKSIKKYILAQEGSIERERIKVSWFDQPETVKNGRKTHRLDSSINFFGRTG
jgi:tetratricopeptide (TPR) repeat protein